MLHRLLFQLCTAGSLYDLLLEALHSVSLFDVTIYYVLISSQCYFVELPKTKRKCLYQVLNIQTMVMYRIV